MSWEETDPGMHLCIMCRRGGIEVQDAMVRRSGAEAQGHSRNAGNPPESGWATLLLGNRFQGQAPTQHVVKETRGGGVQKLCVPKTKFLVAAILCLAGPLHTSSMDLGVCTPVDRVTKMGQTIFSFSGFPLLPL